MLAGSIWQKLNERVLAGECLNQRIPVQATLKTEIAVEE